MHFHPVTRKQRTDYSREAVKEKREIRQKEY